MSNSNNPFAIYQEGALTGMNEMSEKIIANDRKEKGKEIQKKVDDTARKVSQRPPEQLRVKPSHKQCSSFPYGPDNSRRLSSEDCSPVIDEKKPFTQENVREYATQMVEAEVCEAVKFIYTRENFASREEVKKVINDLINCHNSINDDTYSQLERIVGNFELDMRTALKTLIDVSNHHRCFLRKILCAFPVSAKLVCVLLDYICIHSLDKAKSDSLVSVINSAKRTICGVCDNLEIDLCIRTIMVMHVYAALSVLQYRDMEGNFKELENPFLVRIMQIVSLNPNLVQLLIIPTDYSILGKLNQWLGIKKMTTKELKNSFSETVKVRAWWSIMIWLVFLVISAILIYYSGTKMDDITLSGFTKDVVKQYREDERDVPAPDIMLDNAISDILLVAKDKQDYYTRRVYYPWMVFAGSLLAGAGGGPPAALLANVVGTFAASFLGTGTFGMSMVGTGLSGLYLDSPGNTQFAHLPLPGDDYYPERNAQSKQIKTLVKRKQEEAVQKATQFAIRTMNETVSWEKTLQYWALRLGSAYLFAKIFKELWSPSKDNHNLTMGQFHNALTKQHDELTRNKQIAIETIMVDRVFLVSVRGLNAKVNSIVKDITKNVPDRIEEQLPYSDTESESESDQD